jgi:H+-translocating NAD(P) transhydrogenase subunit alpha
MKIAILKERRDGETRVAATPETVKKYVAQGDSVVVEAGAGVSAAVVDAAYVEAGAAIAPSASDALKDADLLMKVRRPSAEEIAGLKPGAGVVALMAPYADKDQFKAYADKGVDALVMEFVPRITRAQSMDALSSQANLAGYRAVMEAAALYGRAFPMMMTAAGTVAPAKTFIMGVGVAGLQAIATARRLGGVVTATDVRPATKEQVVSLGAKFIAVEDEEFKAAETSGGYAKEMSAEYQAKQRALVSAHVAKQDIVITTALIPGRPAPVLVTEDMVASMRPGSVIVDLAVEQGGNCPLSKPDELVVTDNGVRIMGFTNLPGRMAADSSALYAKNLLALLPLLRDKETGAYAPARDDEIVKAALAVSGGQILNPNLAS